MLTFLRRAASAIALFASLALTPAAQAAEGDVHLFTGNPSGASAERAKADNYLLRKRQYALSYNSSTGTPNWVSWQLSKAWLGKSHRANPFAPDTSLPAGFFRVRPRDYDRSGFDRGHLCPAADRSVSHEDMDPTFLMTNMVPQAPDLNRVGWAKLEEYCRSQAREGDEDLYVIAGPAGKGGTGSGGPAESIPGAGGQVTVPGKCWKVVLAVPTGTSDPRKVTAEARVFAVVMPNVQGLGTDWREHAVPVREVERLTGYTFFDRLPRDVGEDLRSRKPQTRERATKPRPKEAATVKVKGLELPAFVQGCLLATTQSKKYHLPGGRYYESGKESKHAVFFKTEEDAQKAGYTRSLR